MPMKRRGFVKGLLIAPVVAPVLPLLAHQTPSPNTPITPAQTSAPVPPPRVTTPAKLATIQVDIAADTTQRFFKREQFSALEKLGDVLVPPLNGKPGATQAEAALFLDFLINESPADRQQLYRHGLDGLSDAARKHFTQSFGELNSDQVGTILKPLLVVRFWPQDMPEDPMQHFVAQAHEDLQTATANSREWAQASAANTGGRHRFNRAAGLYWSPIDPVVKG